MSSLDASFLRFSASKFILYVHHVPGVSFVPFPLKSYLWYHFIKYRIVSPRNVIFWENDTVLEDFYLEKFQKNLKLKWQILFSGTFQT